MKYFKQKTNSIKGEFTIVLGPLEANFEVVNNKNEESNQIDFSTQTKVMKKKLFNREFRNKCKLVNHDNIPSETTIQQAEENIKTLLLEMQKTGVPRSEAVRLVSGKLKVPRSVVYGFALNIQIR